MEEELTTSWVDPENMSEQEIAVEPESAAPAYTAIPQRFATPPSLNVDDIHVAIRMLMHDLELSDGRPSVEEITQRLRAIDVALTAVVGS